MCFKLKINTNGFSAKTQWYNILIFRRKKRTYIVHPIDDLLKLSSASHQTTASTLKKQNTFNIDVNESPSSYYARLMIGGPASDFIIFNQRSKYVCCVAYLIAQKIFCEAASSVKEKQRVLLFSFLMATFTCKVHLFKDQVYGASRIDVHKVNFGIVVDEFCTSSHSVGKATFHLKT